MELVLKTLRLELSKRKESLALYRKLLRRKPSNTHITNFMNPVTRIPELKEKIALFKKAIKILEKESNK